MVSKRGWLDGARPPDVFGQTVPFGKGTPKGVRRGRIEGREGYKQFEYVKAELKHYFACANVVVSRAGANAICELLALRKPNILIPLGLEASRGDQILNAESFEKQGYSYVLQEKDVTSETLLNAVNSVYEDRDKYVEAMNTSELANPIETIVNLANQLASQKRKR